MTDGFDLLKGLVQGAERLKEMQTFRPSPETIRHVEQMKEQRGANERHEELLAQINIASARAAASNEALAAYIKAVDKDRAAAEVRREIVESNRHRENRRMVTLGLLIGAVSAIAAILAVAVPAWSSGQRDQQLINAFKDDLKYDLLVNGSDYALAEQEIPLLAKNKAAVNPFNKIETQAIENFRANLPSRFSGDGKISEVLKILKTDILMLNETVQAREARRISSPLARDILILDKQLIDQLSSIEKVIKDLQKMIE